METLTRSENAHGRITMYIDGSFESGDPLLIGQTNELLQYDTNDLYRITGIIPILAYREQFSGEIVRLISAFDTFGHSFSPNVRKLQQYVVQHNLTDIAGYIHSRVWDVVLLINSTGGVFDWHLLLEYFLQLQKQNGGSVTTIASTMAGSSAATLFQSGTRRICQPDTKFMMHYPQLIADTEVQCFTYGNLLPDEIQAFFRQSYDDVMHATTSDVLRQRFLNADPSNGYEVRWKGHESPGFIDSYLESGTTIFRHMCDLTNAKSYSYTDLHNPYARFALEHDIETELQSHFHCEVRFLIRPVDHTSYDCFIAPDTEEIRAYAQQLVQRKLGSS